MRRRRFGPDTDPTAPIGATRASATAPSDRPDIPATAITPKSAFADSIGVHSPVYPTVAAITPIDGRIRRRSQRCTADERLFEQARCEAAPRDDNPMNSLSRSAELGELPLVGDPVLEELGALLLGDLVDLHLADKPFRYHQHHPRVKNEPA